MERCPPGDQGWGDRALQYRQSPILGGYARYPFLGRCVLTRGVFSCAVLQNGR